MKIVRYLLHISLAANQLANALTGGRPDETVSFRAAVARAHGSKFATAVCATLNAVDIHHERPQEDHCQKATRHHDERREAMIR